MKEENLEKMKSILEKNPKHIFFSNRGKLETLSQEKNCFFW
jgi:membrane-bound lytic murein transglycosylase